MINTLNDLEAEVWSARSLGVWDDFWTGVDYAVRVLREAEDAQVRAR